MRAKMVTELVLGMNEAGFVHGDLQVGNAMVEQRKRTALPLPPSPQGHCPACDSC